MKKIVVILILLSSYSVYLQTNKVTSELEYYPLKTGNYFEYLRISQQIPYPADSSGFSIKVLNDTTLENGKRYKILHYKGILKNKDSYYKYERIDSITGLVYRYNKNLSSNEYKMDSLFANLNDKINCSREGFNSLSCIQTICTAYKVATLFGSSFETKEFFDQSFIPGLHYTLVKGVGLYSSYSSEMSSSHTSLKYANVNGNIYGQTITSANNKLNTIPVDYDLTQNYPNPFNPTTTIKFSIPKTLFVNLKVFDLLGREVTVLINEVKRTGNYEIKFDGSSLSSGIYLYQLVTDDKVLTK